MAALSHRQKLFERHPGVVELRGPRNELRVAVLVRPHIQRYEKLCSFATDDVDIAVMDVNHFSSRLHGAKVLRTERTGLARAGQERCLRTSPSAFELPTRVAGKPVRENWILAQPSRKNPLLLLMQRDARDRLAGRLEVMHVVHQIQELRNGIGHDSNFLETM